MNLHPPMDVKTLQIARSGVTGRDKKAIQQAKAAQGLTDENSFQPFRLDIQ